MERENLNIVQELILDRLSEIQETLGSLSECGDEMKNQNQVVEGTIIKFIETKFYKKKDGSGEGHLLKFRVEDSKHNYFDFIAWDDKALSLGNGDYPIGSEVKIYAYKAKNNEGNELTVKDISSPVAKPPSKYVTKDELFDRAGTADKGETVLVQISDKEVAFKPKPDCIKMNNRWHWKLYLLMTNLDSMWLTGKLKNCTKEEQNYRIDYLTVKLCQKNSWRIEEGGDIRERGRGDPRNSRENTRNTHPCRTGEPRESISVYSESNTENNPGEPEPDLGTQGMSGTKEIVQASLNLAISEKFQDQKWWHNA